MKVRKFLLRGYAEFVPTTPAFVMPLFTKDGNWYRQVVENSRIVALEEADPRYVKELGSLSLATASYVGINDTVIYGFKLSESELHFGGRPSLARTLMGLCPQFLHRRHLYAKVYDFVFSEPPPPDESLSKSSWSSTLIKDALLAELHILEELPPGKQKQEALLGYRKTLGFFNKIADEERQYSVSTCFIGAGPEGEALLEGLSRTTPRVSQTKCYYLSEQLGKNLQVTYNKLVEQLQTETSKALEIFVCVSDKTSQKFAIGSAVRNIFGLAAERLSPGFLIWQADPAYPVRRAGSPVMPTQNAWSSPSDQQVTGPKNKGSLH
jgi:hypothetical protein